MKIQTIIALALIFAFASSSQAEHPRDFVSGDAFAVLSIRDGDAINAIGKTVRQQAGFANSESILSNYLSVFIENPAAIDFSEEVLFVIEPTVVAEGQQPTGMFGLMPHLVFICKPKDGQAVKIKNEYLKSSVLSAGWFIATGGTSVPEPKTYRKSPILATLKSKQVSMAVRFSDFWKQFGPTVQMVGGGKVGSMNKPGPDGLISPETKKMANAASKAFAQLMKTCGKLELIALDVDVNDFKLDVNASVTTSNSEDVSIDNRSMLQMASLMADGMVQYAMSGDMTKQLLEYDITALQSASGTGSYPALLTQGMRLLSDLSDDNVVSYNLTQQNGLTIAALTEVEDQREYLAAIPDLMDEFTGILLNNANMSVTPSPKIDNSWDIDMIGTDPEDQKVLNAIFPKGDRIRFRNYGKKRISIALGPEKWKSLTQKHTTPLARLIKSHKDVAIELALAINARDFVCGFVDVSRAAGQADDISALKPTPSAEISLMFGNNQKGYVAHATFDLMGLANLNKDIEFARKEAKSSANTGNSIRSHSRKN